MHFRFIPILLTAAVLLAGCGQQPIHDTTTKENTHTADLESAKAAEEGSTTTLSGKYKIEENEKGFNLTVKEDSILLPLEYMEGTDGLMKSKPFDGVYGVVNGGPGYVFYSDGTIDVVTTHEAEVTKDSISFGGLSYIWKSKDGKILFYDKGDKKQKTPAITMVPVVASEDK